MKRVSINVLLCLLLSTPLLLARAEPVRLQTQLPEFDCVIEPSDIVDVGSAVSGVVATLHVERSELIEAGDVLVELDSGVERATLALARARAGQNTGIELHRANELFGQVTLERNRALFEKSVVSRQTLDQVQSEQEIAALQVRQARDNKRLALLEYQRARSVLDQRTIRSPVSGVVMERYRTVGEYVGDQPILRVAQLDPLHVETIVPVEYLGLIEPGMRAEVRSSHRTDSESRLFATVDRVDRVSDAASGTFGVRLLLPNPDYQIASGLRCDLEFSEKHVTPTSAALKD